MSYEFDTLKNFADKCGIPNKGGVKSGYGHMALANTPMLKFETKYYDDVRKALANTLEKDSKINVFFKGISLMDMIKGNPPKGKYFTLLVFKVSKDLNMAAVHNFGFDKIHLPTNN